MTLHYTLYRDITHIIRMYYPARRGRLECRGDKRRVLYTRISSTGYIRGEPGAGLTSLAVIFQPIFGIPSNYDVIYCPHSGEDRRYFRDRRQTLRWQFSTGMSDLRLSAFKGYSSFQRS